MANVLQETEYQLALRILRLEQKLRNYEDMDPPGEADIKDWQRLELLTRIYKNLKQTTR